LEDGSGTGVVAVAVLAVHVSHWSVGQITMTGTCVPWGESVGGSGGIICPGLLILFMAE
jgi:hypothetical protein